MGQMDKWRRKILRLYDFTILLTNTGSADFHGFCIFSIFRGRGDPCGRQGRGKPGPYILEDTFFCDLRGLTSVGPPSSSLASTVLAEPELGDPTIAFY